MTTDHDLFPTVTVGLAPVFAPQEIRLADGDRWGLSIGPVRKGLRGDAAGEPGCELRMLAYNGSIPGPILRVRQGSEITVDVHNDGDVETTVHWHGLRLENRRSTEEVR
jgi:FtsP/CotA-like multicopper oxidase with cupredoxin domain